jgi:hypothetical protein
MLALKRLLARRWSNRSQSRSMLKARPDVESLESRLVLYSATGNAWPHPQLITISFMPDGTNLGGPTSNLQSTFNANSRLNGVWQNIILKAAQSWAQQTNINFAVVSDNGAPFGSGNNQQGDPGFGDIRIGGYSFCNSTLAEAYMPPSANNFSIAGDVWFNTGQHFTTGSAYDLFTVAAHEIGHALGLDHSTTSPYNIMYPTYDGTKTVLTSDDIAGIQSLYGGARAPDAYNSGGHSDGSFSTAANLNSLINTQTDTARVQNLDLNTVGQSEYYIVTVPSGTNGTMQLHVQSSGLSLLSPQVTVYASDQTTVLGSACGLNQYGTTLTVNVSGVTTNQALYIKVKGADATAFSTGNYAMTLNFGNNATPIVPLPLTTTPNGNPINAGGGLPDSLPGTDTGHHHPHGPKWLGAHHNDLHHGAL